MRKSFVSAMIILTEQGSSHENEENEYVIHHYSAGVML